MKKEENFSEWYNEIVELANLSDKRYPIKGMNVWTPYGWKIMLHIGLLPVAHT
jgi:prolyl-tRNA synthetase